jgi:transketolase
MRKWIVDNPTSTSVRLDGRMPSTAEEPGSFPRAVTGTAIRRIVLEQSKRANVGHIGSALSVADLVAALYGRVLRLPRSDHPDRDRFILSKGHAVLAVYAALALRGQLPAEQLETYCGDASVLGVHPEHVLPGVDFSTGSLGHGLSFAAGAALAARMQGSARRAFVLLSDAECNEGSVWEAAMFAAHHRLASLVALIDLNGQQALGYTDDVLSLSPMAERWRAFGWDVHEVDGHDADRLVATIAELDTASGPPHVLVARTVFGKGVSYMERQIKWHYSPMSDDEYRRALAEITEQERSACEPRSSVR